MEREVGGGIGMRNTCKPMAVSFQCMTKFTTNKKKKKKKFRIQERTAVFKVSLAPIFVKLLLSPFTTPCCPL